MANAAGSTRILLVTRNLPPLVGGMERLNWHLAEALSVSAEISVISPKGSADLAPEGVRVCEVPLRPLGFFLVMAFLTALREALSKRPEVIVAGSGLTAPIAVCAAKVSRAQSLVYAHGLDIVAPSRIYRAIWLPAIRRADRVVVNSHATRRLCENAGIEGARISIVHPGVTIAISRCTEDEKTRIREELGLETNPILLSVGRLSARKGLLEFVCFALPAIADTYRDVQLLVVGDAPENALLARKTHSKEQILRAARDLGLERHIWFLGGVSDERLKEIFAIADVHIFPILDIPNDPEGFGMVAVEAAAHGVPTVAFASGGVPDAVKNGVSGDLIEPGNYGKFAEAVVRSLREPSTDSSRHAAEEFSKQFSWRFFGENIRKILHGMMSSEP